MKDQHIVIGIIVNQNKQVCIARRHKKVHLGGLWEFPGGKVEENENAYQALKRELLEELGIVVQAACPWQQCAYQDAKINMALLLDFWLVQTFQGQAMGVEGQPIKWVEAMQINDYNFPEANKAVIERLIAQGVL